MVNKYFPGHQPLVISSELGPPSVPKTSQIVSNKTVSKFWCPPRDFAYGCRLDKQYFEQTTHTSTTSHSWSLGQTFKVYATAGIDFVVYVFAVAYFVQGNCAQHTALGLAWAHSSNLRFPTRGMTHMQRPPPSRTPQYSRPPCICLQTQPNACSCALSCLSLMPTGRNLHGPRVPGGACWFAIGF